MDDHYTLEERISAREMIAGIRACSPPVAKIYVDALEMLVAELLDELESARDMALERKE